MSDERRQTGDSGTHPGDSTESEPIKVTDRRKFHSTGDLRESAGEAQEAATEQEEVPPSAAAPPDPAVSSSQKPETPPSGEKPDREPAAKTGAPGQEPLDFRFIVYNLYMSALQMLGVPTQAGAPAGPPDLERAQYFVDFLHILEEKTKGNLAQGEERMLNDVLYDLRMKFVETSRKGPA